MAEQLAYYRAIAGEYHDHGIDVPGQDELLAAIGVSEDAERRHRSPVAEHDGKPAPAVASSS